MALRRLCCFLRKKLTVNGIMGHTQGVNKASSPPTNPDIKINHNDPDEEMFSSLMARISFTTGCHPSCSVIFDGVFFLKVTGVITTAGASSALLSPKENSYFVGGRHVTSLQA